MSAAAIDQLIACEEAFIATLDGEDVGALETALTRLADAVSGLTATGAWRTEGETGTRIVQALRLAEAAKGRLNYLADRNRRRLDKLAQLAGAARPQAYGRAGLLG